MNSEVVIIIADDDEGHAGLIRKNLLRSGIVNEIMHFKDGQEVVDFFLGSDEVRHRDINRSYILLLDIRMPKLNGTEVLKLIKEDDELKKMPVIMITTTDDPKEIEYCHELGCNNYITKPVEYESFVNAIRQLGLFLAVVQVPEMSK